MLLAWRGLARGKFLVMWAVLAVLAGSAAMLYGVYEDDAPLTALSERSSEPGQSTVADRAVETRPPVSQIGVLELRRAELERDRNAPVLGNPEGDVTVVEFFDYNCPFCKKIAGDMRALIEQDTGVRLVYREWPIINKGSQFAARAALAARRQGKYEELHWALMALPRVTEDSTLRVARTIGVDISRLLNDMNHRSVDRHLALSFDLARSLGMNGTPSFVIGDRVARGIITPEELTEYVRDARASKVKKVNE
jgi:protein-disulfide isomerase